MKHLAITLITGPIAWYLGQHVTNALYMVADKLGWYVR